MKPGKAYRRFFVITISFAGAFISTIALAQNNKRYFTGDKTNAGSFNKISIILVGILSGEIELKAFI